MSDAIGATLGLAVGIAISPIPIAAVILMLFSGRARSNSIAFLLAWVAGVALVTSIVGSLPGLGADDGEPADAAGWFKLVLGVLLLAAGVRQWTTRPGPDDEAPVPGWMARIDDLKPAAALGLGFVLSAINPKNLLLAAAAGAAIAEFDLPTSEAFGAIAVFTVIASLTVAIPVIGYLVAGSRLDATLDSTKAWLIGNNAAVMAVLFAVFGAKLVGDAIQILV